MNVKRCRLCGTLHLADDDYCLDCELGASDWNLDEVVELADDDALLPIPVRVDPRLPPAA